MKRLGLLLALALLVGCGGSISSPTIDGNWSGVLRYSDGTTSFFAFTTSLKQGSTSAVTVTNFTITVTPPCAVESPVSVTAELDGGFKNNSSFGMSIGAAPPNQLGIGLTGEVLNNTITGDWTGRESFWFLPCNGPIHHDEDVKIVRQSMAGAVRSSSISLPHSSRTFYAFGDCWRKIALHSQSYPRGLFTRLIDAPFCE